MVLLDVIGCIPERQIPAVHVWILSDYFQYFFHIVRKQKIQNTMGGWHWCFVYFFCLQDGGLQKQWRSILWTWWLEMIHLIIISNYLIAQRFLYKVMFKVAHWVNNNDFYYPCWSNFIILGINHCCLDIWIQIKLLLHLKILKKFLINWK